MLYYLPLESYRERYTMQLSAPIDGWWERNWNRIKLPYTRIEPFPQMTSNVDSGVVLDCFQRCRTSFDQVEKLLQHAQLGRLSSDDVIYFDDFWHPGIEAIRYCFDVMGKKPPKMYAYCWAQSVDEYDFTAKMKGWMRPFEHGIGSILDGVFVANTLLKQLLVDQFVAPKEKIHVVGLPFCSEEVIWRMRAACGGKRIQKQNKVVFSSRWDTEKHPKHFLSVAQLILRRSEDIQFVITTSAPKLRSNDPSLLRALRSMQDVYPNNIIVKAGLTKEQYYRELLEAKVQFNCAYQDWVSFTLLEASVAGCYPVYPNFRSFPETFAGMKEFMYDTHSISEPAVKIAAVCADDTLFTDEAVGNRAWIHERMDSTWKRILIRMGYETSFERDSEFIMNPYAIAPEVVGGLGNSTIVPPEETAL